VSVVVDTNVARVADGHAYQANQACIDACIDAILRCTHGNDVVLIDDGGEILAQYTKGLGFSGAPGVGRAFVKWCWDFQSDSNRIVRIRITAANQTDWRAFEEVPNDASLYGFDRDEHKFVAVAIASQQSPEILNAVDSDWWNFRTQLAAHGVRIRFLCPQHAPTPE